MSEPYKGKPWSYGIIAAILTFMIGTLVMVYILVNQKVDVLFPDYYQRTVNYDQTRKELSYGLEPRFRVAQSWNAQKDSVFYSIPDVKHAIGKIDFLKPDDSGLDQSFAFELENGNAIGIATSGFKKGSWNVELSWKADSISIISRTKIVF